MPESEKKLKIYCTDCGDETEIVEDVQVLFPGMALTCAECKTTWLFKSFYDVNEGDPLVKALKRLTREVGYMLEAPTKDLVVTAETQAAYVEASQALKEIGENLG